MPKNNPLYPERMELRLSADQKLWLSSRKLFTGQGASATLRSLIDREMASDQAEREDQQEILRDAILG